MALRLVFLTAVMISSGAYAQAPDCAAIADSQARLACFDAASKKGTAPAAKAKADADPIIVKARKAVADSLKDPPSARFDGIVKKPEAVCGFVNAKNSYGGYVGRTRFAYVTKTGAIFLEVPITTVNQYNIAEYDRNDAGLKQYCPGVASPFVR